MVGFRRDPNDPRKVWFKDLIVGDDQDELDVAQDALEDQQIFDGPVQVDTIDVDEQILDGHVGDEFHVLSGTVILR